LTQTGSPRATQAHCQLAPNPKFHQNRTPGTSAAATSKAIPAKIANQSPRRR
jgi:hypothetical protein